MAAFSMKERKEPTFVQFADGEMLAGVLVRIDRTQVSNGNGAKAPANRYTVRDLESGEMYSFLGTYQIDTKLNVADIGHVIEVRNEGTNPNVQRNGNAMKVFAVRVSEQPFNPATITDNDIPF